MVEKKTLYVDEDPSPLTISPSKEYDLLFQLSESAGRTFHHILQDYGLDGRLRHIYIRHTPGSLSIVISSSSNFADALKVEKDKYLDFIDKQLKISSLGSRVRFDRDDMTGFFLDHKTRLNGLPEGSIEKYGFKEFSYRDRSGYANVTQAALDYIGWEK